jgi:uncharacterized protein (DUF1778 family)
MATATLPPIARLEARLPSDVHAILKRAAEIQGRTLTDFVVAAAHEAAKRAIEDAELLRLSAEDQARLAKALLKPPAPSSALRRAFRHRRNLLGGA